ncbi:MAG: hypothetical protein Ct9H90mP22_4410 [Gammaproteobacteria bacterium]|nr:MAG: hypothetical protein Ct9H90mP22_4410 [Gammaproteobacteria bacterium]
MRTILNILFARTFFGNKRSNHVWLPTDKFSFYGFFFPKKESLQILFLEELKKEKKTSIFLNLQKETKKNPDASKYLHRRNISICMEMTKIHERVVREYNKYIINF